MPGGDAIFLLLLPLKIMGTMGRQLIDKQALKNVLYGVEKDTCDFRNHRNQRVRLPEGIDVVFMTAMKSLNSHDLHLLVEKPISR